MSQAKYSYKVIKENFEKSKKKEFEKTVVAEKYVYRPVSLLVTPFFLNLGFTANALTAFRFFFGSFGSILFAFPQYLYLAYVISLLAIILDYVDGNIARISRKTTFYGKFLDSFVDNFILNLQYPMIAWGIIRSQSQVLSNEMIIILGLGATCINLFAALVEASNARLRKEIVLLDGEPKQQSFPSGASWSLVYKIFIGIKNLDFSYLFPVMIVFIFCDAMTYYLGVVVLVKFARFGSQLVKILIRGRKELGVLRASSR
jgi:phosphatidylglycerophosphate synthase